MGTGLDKGGGIIGYGNTQTGVSRTPTGTSTWTAPGRIYFGVRPTGTSSGGARITVNTTTVYNDDQWHHIVATLGPDGMQLFVDGTAAPAHRPPQPRGPSTASGGSAATPLRAGPAARRLPSHQPLLGRRNRRRRHLPFGVAAVQGAGALRRFGPYSDRAPGAPGGRLHPSTTTVSPLPWTHRVLRRQRPDRLLQLGLRRRRHRNRRHRPAS